MVRKLDLHVFGLVRDHRPSGSRHAEDQERQLQFAKYGLFLSRQVATSGTPFLEPTQSPHILPPDQKTSFSAN